MADIREVTPLGEVKPYGDAPAETPPVQNVPNQTVTGQVLPELEKKAICQVMGLENDGDADRYSEKIDILLDYAKTQTTDKTLEGLKWAVRNLEMKLGSPPLSEKRINYVAQFAYLELQQKKLQKEKEKFVINSI